jgi:adenosine deaminase
MAEEKETKELLSCEPERLGHATYLDEEAKEVVLARRTCIEICLTSNLLCVIFFSLPSCALHFLLRESLS